MCTTSCSDRFAHYIAYHTKLHHANVAPAINLDTCTRWEVGVASASNYTAPTSRPRCFQPLAPVARPCPPHRRCRPRCRPRRILALAEESYWYHLGENKAETIRPTYSVSCSSLTARTAKFARCPPNYLPSVLLLRRFSPGMRPVP